MLSSATDAAVNITSVSDGTNTTSYVYDSANQLVRENNQAANKTWTFTYDSAGNLTAWKEYAYTTGSLGAVTANHGYTYGDPNWGDLMRVWNGNTITSDAIGNMLSDGTWTYSWQNGRELAAMQTGSEESSVSVTYAYNADGIRTEKTVTTQTYHTHSYTQTVTAPTCTEGGYTTYTCACGDSYQGNETAALGHNYVDTVCTRCGDQLAHTHIMSLIDYAAATCTQAGYTITQCSFCGETQTTTTPALGHSYMGSTCTRCGAKKPTIPPIFGDLTGTQDEAQTDAAAATAASSEPIVESTVTGTYSYVYNGGSLSQLVISTTTTEGETTTTATQTLNFAYDASGTPMALTYNGITYYYATNLQGDVVAILNSEGAAVVTYTYDAWGAPLSMAGTMASTLGVHNPLRYRGYVYDQEIGFYYVSSRYYDPEIGRFINADDVDYLGAGSNLTSYNLFAYCGNNPVMGYDPTGHWDWGGVIAGLGIIAGTVITVATFGIGSPIGAIIAGAAITTGVVTTYAAATDSTMVVDLSYSKQVLPNYYVKGGGSVVIDFKNDNANFYPHIGFGKGSSDGLSYSTGMVDNYEHPDDYAKHFIDINVGYNAGFDHCWNPLEKHDSATQATAVTFSSGGSYGVGYDYYFGPKQILSW